MRLFTIEDFRDIYIKVYQRGFNFLLSKLTFDSYKRTQSAFNEQNLQTSNFWMIPKVKQRWNLLITGSENETYEEYLSRGFLKDKKKFKILALGSGVCSHEIKLAELNSNVEIHCFDFSDKLLNKAKTISDKLGIKNIFYYPENILKFNFKEKEYDAVFFHASLHHFDMIDEFLGNVIAKSLKPNGYLIINEFVGNNRLQYSNIQIEYINKAINVIPREYRKIFKTNLFKYKYYGSGWLRMYLADSSECVDSQSILPSIHKYFNVIEEKPYGNNVLQSALKDIAHHFVILDAEKEVILDKMFKIEDQFLVDHQSDFIFGIYQLK